MFVIYNLHFLEFIRRKQTIQMKRLYSNCNACRGTTALLSSQHSTLVRGLNGASPFSYNDWMMVGTWHHLKYISRWRVYKFKSTDSSVKIWALFFELNNFGGTKLGTPASHFLLLLSLILSCLPLGDTGGQTGHLHHPAVAVADLKPLSGQMSTHCLFCETKERAMHPINQKQPAYLGGRDLLTPLKSIYQ